MVIKTAEGELSDIIVFSKDWEYESETFETKELANELLPYAEYAFKNTSKIEAEDGNKYYSSKDGILYSKDGKILIKCPEKKTGDIIVPEGVEYIQQEAFIASEITSVKFPSSLRKVGANAFCSCHNLKAVDFGDGLYDMWGINVFACCSNLRQVVLPRQMKNLPYGTFMKSGLEKIVLNDGLEDIAPYAFSRCDNLKSIVIPASVEKIGHNALTEVEDIEIDRSAYGGTLMPGFIPSFCLNRIRDRKTFIKIRQGESSAYIARYYPYVKKLHEKGDLTFQDIINHMKSTKKEILDCMIEEGADMDIIHLLEYVKADEYFVHYALEKAEEEHNAVLASYILSFCRKSNYPKCNFCV